MKEGFWEEMSFELGIESFRKRKGKLDRRRLFAGHLTARQPTTAAGLVLCKWRASLASLGLKPLLILTPHRDSLLHARPTGLSLAEKLLQPSCDITA